MKRSQLTLVQLHVSKCQHCQNTHRLLSEIFVFPSAEKFRKNCIEMAGREAVKRSLQQVRPILSVDSNEARRRVLNLYKAWYRQIPYIGKEITFSKFPFDLLCHRRRRSVLSCLGIVFVFRSLILLSKL